MGLSNEVRLRVACPCTGKRLCLHGRVLVALLYTPSLSISSLHTNLITMSNNQDQDPLPRFSQPPKAPRLRHAVLPGSAGPAAGSGASSSSAPPPPASAPAWAPYGTTGPPVPIAHKVHGNPGAPHGPHYTMIQTVATVYGPAHIVHHYYPPLPPLPTPPILVNGWYKTPPPSPRKGTVGRP